MSMSRAGLRIKSAHTTLNVMGDTDWASWQLIARIARCTIIGMRTWKHCAKPHPAPAPAPCRAEPTPTTLAPGPCSYIELELAQGRATTLRHQPLARALLKPYSRPLGLRRSAPLQTCYIVVTSLLCGKSPSSVSSSGSNRRIAVIVASTFIVITIIVTSTIIVILIIIVIIS